MIARCHFSLFVAALKSLHLIYTLILVFNDSIVQWKLCAVGSEIFVIYITLNGNLTCGTGKYEDTWVPVVKGAIESKQKEVASWFCDVFAGKSYQGTLSHHRKHYNTLKTTQQYSEY